MRSITLYIARAQPANTIPVRYWRLLPLPKRYELALTRLLDSPVVSPEQQEGKVTMHKWVRLRKSEPLRCEHCGVYYAAQWSVVCPGRPAPPSPEQEQQP